MAQTEKQKKIKLGEIFTVEKQMYAFIKPKTVTHTSQTNEKLHILVGFFEI